MDEGIVFELQRWCTDDGPGIRTTVFFQGCPLRCPWCCNPEAWCPPPPDGAEDPLRGRRMTTDEIVAAVERDRVFYRRSGGGVTFSGGEPTAQPELLLHLARRLRGAGVHLALETCGHFPWEPNAEALGLMDLVFLDLKHLDDAAHRRLTGVGNGLILENAVRLAAAGIPMVLRVPLIPGCNDGPDNLAATAAFASRLGGPPVEVMPYHRLGLGKYRVLGLPYPLEGLEPPSAEAVARARRILVGPGHNR
ncbi:MAG: glycyl-radical enzyme activating protein [Holophaga sp.]|jgi:pyruvate formate lyase activating enzyme